MPGTPSTSRRTAVPALGAALLIVLALVLWSIFDGGADAPLGRGIDGSIGIEPTVRMDVDLAVDSSAVAGAGDSPRARATAPESDAAPGRLQESELAPAPDTAPYESAPIAFIDTPVEHVPVGDSVVLDLVVRAPATIGSPRLPAWLDLERGGAEPDVRRVLGDIEGDRWTFVVDDLEPGRHRWTVRTGIHAPIAGDARLEVGRNEVRYELVDLPASTVTVAAGFPWGAAGGDGNAGEAAESVALEEVQSAFSNDPHAPSTFGPSSPWVAFDGATPDDTVLVPLDGWFDAFSGIVSQQGPFEARTGVFGAPLGTVRPHLLGGLPISHNAVVEGEGGGARVEVLEREDGVVPLSIQVKVRVPQASGASSSGSAAEAVRAVTAVLYGAVPEDLGALDRLDGPTMWRAIEVPLPFVSEMLPTGTLRLDPRTTPRGARVAFMSPGMQPIFRGLDALLEAKQVFIDFQPGSGGVLVAAYQNHRFPQAHWAPAFGFDVIRGPDKEALQRAESGMWNEPLVDVRRTGPMGWIEYAFTDERPFDATSLIVVRPAPNAERLDRAVYPKLLMELRDAAPGVVELFVQD